MLLWRICVANDDERDIKIDLCAWKVANGVIFEYFKWDWCRSSVISCSRWWQVHEQRLGLEDMEDEEQISDDDDDDVSVDDVEQFEEERLLSNDDDDDVWAIRESKEVVERVARRVVGVVDDELGDVWRESKWSDSESLQIPMKMMKKC